MIFFSKIREFDTNISFRLNFPQYILLSKGDHRGVSAVEQRGGLGCRDTRGNLSRAQGWTALLLLPTEATVRRERRQEAVAPLSGNLRGEASMQGRWAPRTVAWKVALALFSHLEVLPATQLVLTGV